MPSLSVKSPETEGVKLLFLTIPVELLLQLGTGSMLLALLGGKAVAQTLQVTGQASEEVFRGDRLPLLKFPENDSAASSK